MESPIDFWTIPHALVGIFFGRIRLPRLIQYPIPIIWEIYQLYFHYQPHGIMLGGMWLNSLFDILACVVCYEITLIYWKADFQNFYWQRINGNIKAIGAYLILAIMITWLFWDDVLGSDKTLAMPWAQLPIFWGAFSPLAAVLIIRNSIYKDTSFIEGWKTFFPGRWNDYMIKGIIPSAAIAIILVVIQFRA
jgi:hypothetical protein